MPRPRTLARLGRLDRSDLGGGAVDAEGRRRDRHARVAVATVAGAASRGLALLTVVVALPLAASHLDPAELGVWSLLVTAVALLGFADLGLSNGLMNVLADALGRDDHVTARKAVTASAAGLCALAVAGAALAAVAIVAIPWERVLNVDPTQVPSLDAALIAFAACVLASIPAGLGQRVHLAYQQGWAASLTSGIGSLLSLAFVAAAALTDAGLPWFVAAMLGGTALAALGETAWVLGRSHRDLRPARRDLDLQVLGQLRRSGLLFFVLAAAGAAAYQSDTIVISHYLGAAEVTRYAIALRLFTLVPTALAALLLPLWPVYGEALAREDLAWVRTTLRRSALLALGATGASSLLLLFVARPVLEVWTPDVPAPDHGLLLALGAWAVVSTVSTAIAMYLNGANVIRLQVVVAILMAVANLALSIVLVQEIGVAGPVWASVITQVLLVLVPEAWVLWPMLRGGLHRGAERRVA
jgi:O-antigen/teichoic acid export membrane protein